MKFLCVKCDEQMKYKEVNGTNDGSVSITFTCLKCRNEVILMTNPGETQLVRALDVKIGGKTVPHQPMELLRGTLAKRSDQAFFTQENAPDENLAWSKEAEDRLVNAPSFVREMVRRGTERYATAKGYNEVTSQVLDEAKEDMGLHPDG